MNRDKKPLYRKEKKTGLRTQYYVNKGGEARWDRNTKQEKLDAENEIKFKGIKKKRLGYDYTPLYKFLLSKVGQPWDKVYSEAKSRLDDEKHIFSIVELHPTQHDLEYGVVRVDEGSYYSQLIIVDGIIAKANPEAKAPMAFYEHDGWTRSFNGKPVTPNPLTKNY